MRIKGILTGVLIGMLSMVLCAGCSFMEPGTDTQENTQAQVNGIITATPGIYDSEDTAMIVCKDTENAAIQFQNLATGKRYTLNYDGAAKLLDKYDQPVSLGQIEEGSIVTVRFYKPKKLLAYLKISPEGEAYENLSNYVLNTATGTLTIGDTSYGLSNHLLVLSDGQEVTLMDINQMDVLNVWGWHNQIYAISIARGHGYLRLQNDAYFVGGWIEVGQSVIRKITEDMLLVVPEGRSTVVVSHNGSSATQEIDFVRNQEMAWDLGDVEITVVQKGRVIFTLNPANAKVTIDGKNVDTASPVELEYGLHQMTVTADGYDTVAQYIKVAEPSASISVELEKSEESTEQEETKEQPQGEEQSQEQSNTVSTQTAASTQSSTEQTQASSAQSSSAEQPETQSSATQSTATQTSYKVHIDSPVGAEVYLDGNYIGISPVDFEKKAGNYVVSLRKTGYQTRSYTLQVDSEEKDVTYSFSELTKLDS